MLIRSSAAARRSALSLLKSVSTSRSAVPSLQAALCPSLIAANSTVAAYPFRAFSDDSGSHSDFAPKRKNVSDDDQETLDMIKSHVESNRIMLYMKGSPNMPMCGFSARVVQVLKDEDVDFSSVNVLDYPAIREGVKKYSDWPTIPQLYVDGEFIGGCDIVTSMHENGELKDLLNEADKE